MIDADALNLLAARPEIIRQPAGPRIFTHHPGEMARMLGCTIHEVQSDRLKAAQWLTDTEGLPPMITVLKGAGTVVAANDGGFALNTSGNPGMGSGGMGDVLAGIIGGLLAQGYTPWQAACFGVYLHGLAGDYLATKQPWGYLATEVAQALPTVLGRFINNQRKEQLC